MATRSKEIVPAVALHPGEVLRRELLERGIKQKDFAKMIGMQATHLSSFITGKRDLSDALAEKLEAALGISYSTWQNLQRGYRRDVEAISEKKSEEAAALDYERACNELFNLKYLYKRLSLWGRPLIERVAEIRTMFPMDLRAAGSLRVAVSGLYKHSEKAQIDEKNMTTWLLLNRLEMFQSAKAEGYEEGNALKAAREIAAMANARTLTPEGIKACMNHYGITYLHVEKVEKAPIDAFSTIIDGYPYITVTYRYNDMDKLAFDLLHELFHIDKHLPSGGAAFIAMEGCAYATDPREKEANAFARDMLISGAEWRKLMGKGCKSLSPHAVIKRIACEAERMGISPSIAVARYKHETGWYKTRAYRSPVIR